MLHTQKDIMFLHIGDYNIIIVLILFIIYMIIEKSRFSALSACFLTRSSYSWNTRLHKRAWDVVTLTAAPPAAVLVASATQTSDCFCG